MNKEFIEKTVVTAMHVAGTVQMGPPGDKTACLDTDFRVRGLESLRVADMSIVPELIRYVHFLVFKLLLVWLIGNRTHSQSTAYLIGHIASKKIVAEYEN